MIRFYSYSVRKRDDGLFEVYCDQDGSIHSVHEDEYDADFIASEAYSDDAAEINHEKRP